MKRPLVSTVSAYLRERIVVNFSVDPAAMAAALPCDWLVPKVVNGQSVVSFCVLWLEHVTPRGWPSALMPSQVSCAVRFGVTDLTTGDPSVYVVDRCTDSALGSLATRVGCPGFHPIVSFSDTRVGDWRRIEVGRAGEPYMSFELGEQAGLSGVFGSADEFARFIGEGVRSYTPAVRPGVLNVVDLVKEESVFEPHAVRIVESAGLPEPIRQAGRLDSAFRTTNARYEWRFVDQRSFESPPAHLVA